MVLSSRKKQLPAMTLEGVLGPNNRLDEAEGFKVDAPQSLCVGWHGQLLFSSRNAVHLLAKWGATPELWSSFDAPVTALCTGPSGDVAIGLEGGRIAVLDGAGGQSAEWPLPKGLKSVVDCTFASAEEIVVVDNGFGPDEDFMSVAPWDESARGSVVIVSRSGTSKVLASGLHCPMGITRDFAGEWIVTLFERASVVDLAGRVRQGGYPAYPGRIHRTPSGYVMACLARRDPLIEFLKTEKEFIAEMRATMDPRYWISPRATPEFSHDFPIEAGATRLFGEIKPWAPSFSYGLVVELDENFLPVGAAHSRANGLRHQITDAIIWNGDLVAVSGASGEILNVGPGSTAE